ILKDELPYCFREFKPFIDGCKFTSCSHTCDKGCAVCKAVDDGIIPKSRLDSYISMYNDVKDIKQWQMK
ncbi:MAG: ribosome small subunit-dependent GTPase A, partial [Eubacterium sp.]